jgi:dynein heavy chain 2
MNHDTREFTDGVLTASARQVVKEPNDTVCWIICDGDIDPEWIESLNSVLDDNHLLTMPNGERISFGDNVNFIFETNDMRFASPATVSRLGMIFLSEEDVEIERITKTWLDQQPEDLKNKLNQWMDDIMRPALEWALDRQKEMVTETTKVGIVNNVLAYLKDIKSKGQFTYGVSLGLGSNFEYKIRRELITFTMTKAGERGSDPNVLLNYFDAKSQCWSNFVQEDCKNTLDDMKNPDNPPIVMTPTIQKDMALVKPLLDSD